MKETLIDFAKYVIDFEDWNIKETPESLVDEYLKSINEASNESLNVSDNETKQKACIQKNGCVHNKISKWYKNCLECSLYR